MIQGKNPISWKMEEVSGVLDVFSKAQLNEHISIYSKVFLKKEEQWLLKQESYIVDATEVVMSIIRNKKTNKDALLAINALPFLSTHTFKRFVKILPEDTQKILAYVLLNGSIGFTEVEKKFGIASTIKDPKPNWQGVHKELPSPKLRFFVAQSNSSYWSSYYNREDMVYMLPSVLRKLILPLYFPEPLVVPTYTSHTDSIKEKTFIGESLIQEELPGLLIRLQQKPLKLTKKGRPSIASVRSIGKKLKIQEFYPNTEEPSLKHIRVSALVGLLALTEQLNADNIIQQIKQLFILEFEQKFHIPIHMLSYIVGINRLDSYYLKNCAKHYMDVIAKLPQGEWFDFPILVKSLKIQGFDIFPISEYGMRDLRFEVPDPNSPYRETRTVHIYPNKTERMILWPSFRAAMFIMASWGLLDMIYEDPDLQTLSETADSPYDAIKAIRINDLGAFVLGISETYETNIKAPFSLELSDDSLSILLTDGDQERAAMAIASFAKPFGGKRFYTDVELFLGDCKSPADLDHKIRIFKTVFSQELPSNWQEFFTEISQKVNPLQLERDFSIFRLNHDNINLLQIIARDPELKRLCLKAEGFLILIAKKDIAKFRKRLQVFGYLLE